MTRPFGVGAALAIALCVALARPEAVPCRDVRVDQQNYAALSPLVYAYVPNIDKSGGGWKAFVVRIIVGQYRSPLLLQKGFMREADLNKLLSQRPDLSTKSLPVPAYAPKAQQSQPQEEAITVVDGRKASTTISVKAVEPAAGVSVRSDRVVLLVCS